MSEIVLRYVAQTMVKKGFDCAECNDIKQKIRGCRLHGFPPLPTSGEPTQQTFYCGGTQKWFDCATSRKTPEHYGLFRLFLHWRAGQSIYPSLLDYPNRLLRQLEVLDNEVRQLEAALKPEDK